MNKTKLEVTKKSNQFSRERNPMTKKENWNKNIIRLKRPVDEIDFVSYRRWNIF